MSDADQRMLLESETSFGLNLLSTISTNDSFVFSPFSIALALSLVHSGAKQDTRSEISNVILNGATDDDLVKFYSNISANFRNSKNGVETKIATRIFAREAFAIHQEYLEKVESDYNAGAETLDFDDQENAAEKINNYVNESTEGKINRLVTEDQFADAVAFLINCVYFKGKWRNQFSPSSTIEMNFSTSENNIKSIPFMRMFRERELYSSDDQFHVLSLPYKDMSYSFAIFLPKVKYGLKDAMKDFNAEQFQSLLQNQSSQLINYQIPKMKITNELNLKTTLETLGIRKMFSNVADLSGIANDIKISDAIHKSIIEVDEAGTTAAAATGVIAVPLSMPIGEPINFTADHPFLFALLKDNHPLFMGLFQE